MAAHAGECAAVVLDDETLEVVIEVAALRFGKECRKGEE
jgi:hypothetical protein